MDLATLIGLIGSFAFVIMAMVLGGSISMFIDTQSILIVFCGSMFVALMQYSIGQFFLAQQKLQPRPLCLKQTILKI